MASDFDSQKPQDTLATTAEMAEIALAQLQAGDINPDWQRAAHALTLCTGEPHAVTEGTLLMTAADLVTIGSSEDITRVNRASRRIGPYLEFAEMMIRRDGLRPIGRAILDQCVQVAPTDDLRTRLSGLTDPSGT